MVMIIILMRSRLKAKVHAGVWFLSVPLARRQHGFPSGAGSVCSGTQHGICSLQQSLETLKSVS